MQIRGNEKTMRIICIQINESEQMRSFFFFFFPPPLPSTRQSSHPADIISTGRAAAAAHSRLSAKPSGGGKRAVIGRSAPMFHWSSGGQMTAARPRLRAVSLTSMLETQLAQ